MSFTSPCDVTVVGILPTLKHKARQPLGRGCFLPPFLFHETYLPTCYLSMTAPVEEDSVTSPIFRRAASSFHYHQYLVVKDNFLYCRVSPFKARRTSGNSWLRWSQQPQQSKIFSPITTGIICISLIRIQLPVSQHSCQLANRQENLPRCTKRTQMTCARIVVSRGCSPFFPFRLQSST